MVDNNSFYVYDQHSTGFAGSDKGVTDKKPHNIPVVMINSELM